MLAAHPFKRAPDRVNKAVLRVTMQAPHGLVLAPGVLEAHQHPAALERTPGGLSTPLTALAGPKAQAVAAGALLTLVSEATNQLLRGLLRRTRYTSFDQEGLLLVRASGC